MSAQELIDTIFCRVIEDRQHAIKLASSHGLVLKPTASDQSMESVVECVTEFESLPTKRKKRYRDCLCAYNGRCSTDSIVYMVYVFGVFKPYMFDDIDVLASKLFLSETPLLEDMYERANHFLREKENAMCATVLRRCTLPLDVVDSKHYDVYVCVFDVYPVRWVFSDVYAYIRQISIALGQDTDTVNKLLVVVENALNSSLECNEQCESVTDGDSSDDIDLRYKISTTEGRVVRTEAVSATFNKAWYSCSDADLVESIQKIVATAWKNVDPVDIRTINDIVFFKFTPACFSENLYIVKMISAYMSTNPDHISANKKQAYVNLLSKELKCAKSVQKLDMKTSDPIVLLEMDTYAELVNHITDFYADVHSDNKTLRNIMNKIGYYSKGHAMNELTPIMEQFDIGIADESSSDGSCDEDDRAWDTGDTDSSSDEELDEVEMDEGERNVLERFDHIRDIKRKYPNDCDSFDKAVLKFIEKKQKKQIDN